MKENRNNEFIGFNKQLAFMGEVELVIVLVFIFSRFVVGKDAGIIIALLSATILNLYCCLPSVVSEWKNEKKAGIIR